MSNDGKFPPTPSKKYINLAIVSRGSKRRDLEDLRKYTLHGRVDELLSGKEKIEIGDILKPVKGELMPVSLVFIEGPPGIGKSSLAWELCRKWDRTQYDLAVLLRLRKRDVQAIKDIPDLFPYRYDKDLQSSVAKEVIEKEGDRVLFILDGYDEFPLHLRDEGILIDLLSGEVLPKSSVVVTSRPSATCDLYMTCRPLVQRHVEILGFTDEQVKEYASSIFSEPELLEDFLLYVSASKNPAINSLMYVPLNAAIIVEIYRSNRKKGSPIPQTMTQLYTQLCLTLFQRHVSSTKPDTDIVSFSDLSSTDKKHLLKLAQLAYSKFEQQEVVFYSDSVSKDMVHFGLLDSVPALHGGGGVSYNFLHLTVQEFLAAYHVTRDPNGAGAFHCYGEDPRWNMVWRFVSGLTGFQFFKDHTQSCAFVKADVQIEVFLMQCLFEAQIQFNYAAAFPGKIYVHIDNSCSPLDMYAIGYCLVHSSARTSWQVQLQKATKNFNYYIWGLNSNPNTDATIVGLVLSDSHMPFLDQYPARILQGIKYLNLLCLVSPWLPEVRKYHLPYSLLANTLTRFECSGNIPDPLQLCNAVFVSSSLKEIDLSLPHFPPNSFAHLETNTSITQLEIEWTDKQIKSHGDLSMLLRILNTNRTIERLTWKYLKMTFPQLDREQLHKIHQALSSNTVLKEFTLYRLRFRPYTRSVFDHFNLELW